MQPLGAVAGLASAPVPGLDLLPPPMSRVAWVTCKDPAEVVFVSPAADVHEPASFVCTATRGMGEVDSERGGSVPLFSGVEDEAISRCHQAGGVPGSHQAGGAPFLYRERAMPVEAGERRPVVRTSCCALCARLPGCEHRAAGLGAAARADSRRCMACARVVSGTRRYSLEWYTMLGVRQVASGERQGCCTSLSRPTSSSERPRVIDDSFGPPYTGARMLPSSFARRNHSGSSAIVFTGAQSGVRSANLDTRRTRQRGGVQ